MEFLRKLRWVLYPIVFLLMFLLGAYCSFPKDVLQEAAETSITKMLLDMNPKAQSVPKVTVAEASLWRFLGVSLQGVTLAWVPSKNGDLPLDVNFDTLKAKVGLFSYLVGGRNILAKAKLYDGELESAIKIKKSKELRSLQFQAEKINLAKMGFIEALVGSPLVGTLNASAGLDASTDLVTDGTGNIDISIKQVVFGPGFLKMPSDGFLSQLTVPKVLLGDFVANLALENGQINSKKFEFTGGDLEGELALNIALGKVVSASKVTGDGWFSLKKEFINNNETVKMLFDLVPELKEASLGSGKVPISVRGTLKSLRFSLGAAPPGLSDSRKLKRPGADSS